MRRHGVLPRLSGMRPGDHACYAFLTAADFRRMVADYFSEGAALGQQLLFMRGRGAPDDMVTDFGDAGLDAVIDLEARAQLLIVDPPAVDSMHGLSAALQDGLRMMTRQADASGFTGLRVAADATWGLAVAGDVSDVLTHELSMDRVVSETSATVVCGFHRPECTTGSIRLLEAIHPLEVGSDGDRTRFHLVMDGGDQVAVTGEVDLADEREFREALRALTAVVACPMLNLGALEFIDVRGLRVLADVARTLGERDRRLVLRHPSQLVRTCLSSTGLDRTPGLVID